jgi:tRNA-dihydrouridine synthase 1
MMEENIKRADQDEYGNQISRKRLKKLRRIARRPNRQTIHIKRGSNLCENCPNPLVSF